MLRTFTLALLAAASTCAPAVALQSPPRLPETIPAASAGSRWLNRLPITDGPQLASSRIGYASWYGPGFHGKQTANGERYNQWATTAAHPSLPFGTRVRVTNLSNGRSTVVRINDRGPYYGGRVIDLSRSAADHLGMTSAGVARVKLQVVN